MTSKLALENLLAECEREVDRYAWNGTFADYLTMVLESPSVSRLSHKLIYDAILAKGKDESAAGQPAYALFSGEIYGLNATLAKIVQYFASGAQRLEIRKRILLLLGPPASGKSSIVALIKEALEDYTRSAQGSVYAIKGCPMQEEPLHLVPSEVRPRLMEKHGVYVEGNLCPRCRYVLRSQYHGKVSQMPVSRVTFSEHEAIGIGYFMANNPNRVDASLLVGSVDASQLEGDRLEVAGKAFRLDGELNVANRGLVEFVEIFKADRNLLTTLLSLAQEQLIKMERFGSVYADEVIIAHSNEGDFNEFKSDEHSEALRDRTIAIRVPYNLNVNDEVEIYRKMLKSSALHDVHLPPLTLRIASTFAVLSRLGDSGPGVSQLDTLRRYSGEKLQQFSWTEVEEERRRHPDEGMKGISPRHVMNRLSSAASEVTCLSPLKALDSLWQGRRENVSMVEEEEDEKSRGELGFDERHVEFFRDSVEEYTRLARREVQRASKEGFEELAADVLSRYLRNIGAEGPGNEREMRDLEKKAGILDKDRTTFRRSIREFFEKLESREIPFDYTSEPRVKFAIEELEFPKVETVRRSLSEPKFARQKPDWSRRRSAIYNRLIDTYGYCSHCANDLLDYVVRVRKVDDVVKSPRNMDIEWQRRWDPTAHGTQDDAP